MKQFVCTVCSAGYREDNKPQIFTIIQLSAVSLLSLHVTIAIYTHLHTLTLTHPIIYITMHRHGSNHESASGGWLSYHVVFCSCLPAWTNAWRDLLSNHYHSKFKNNIWYIQLQIPQIRLQFTLVTLTITRNEILQGKSSSRWILDTEKACKDWINNNLYFNNK